MIGCNITLAARRPPDPIICGGTPPGCCCNCIIRVVDKFPEGITFAADTPATPATPLIEAGRVGFALIAADPPLPITPVFVTLVTIVGASWGIFGVRILIFVVFNLAVENDLAKGIGRICLGAVNAVPAPDGS